jgi:hypothetical protein
MMQINFGIFVKNLSASARHFLKGAAPFCHQGAPLCPFTSKGVPCPSQKIVFKIFIANLWYQHHQGDTQSDLNVLKLMGKHFINPKSSQVFPCTT